MNGVQDAPLGLLSFLSFAFSIIAAVSAIDMYKLLRTGEFGKTWRLLIIASVMLALLQVLRMAEVLNFRPVREAHLAQIVELCFIMSLAYAFYVQRKLFSHESKRPAMEDDENFLDDDADDADDERASEDDETEHAFFEEYDDKDDSLKPPTSWTKHENADISRPTP